MAIEEAGAEAVLIAAGGRAILLQLAHPSVGRAIAEHSEFDRRPLDRLHATLTYVYAVACGSDAEIAFVARRVNHAHGPVVANAGRAEHGTPAAQPAAPPTPGYSAFTPSLQLWVAATLYDSALTMHERVYGPLEPALADRIYLEYAQLGTTLQVPPGLWPADRAAFDVYWRASLAALTTDAATRAVAHQLLYPRNGPLWFTAAMPLARLLTAGLVPPEVRSAFRLPWTARSARRFERVMRLISATYPALPQRIRHWPKNHYLRALRSAMENEPT